MDNSSTNGLRSIYGYYRRYIFLLLALFTIIIASFCLLIYKQSSTHKAYDNSVLQEKFIDFTEHIEGRFKNISNQIEELRYTAQIELHESRNNPGLKPLAFNAIKYYPEKNSYNIDKIPEEHKNYITSNLTGLGKLSDRSPLFYRLINMSLSLMDEFFIIQKNNVNLKYLFFFTEHNFIIFNPWEPSSMYEFETEVLTYDLYTKGTPENNPQKTVYWTDVYEDNGTDNLLMTSCAAPVYDNKKFVGIMGADVSVNFLANVMKTFEPTRKGVTLIYDNSNKVIASSQTEQATKQKLVSLSSLYPELSCQKLLKETNNTFLSFGNWQLLKAPISNTPFHITYIRPRTSTFHAVINSLGLNMLAVILLSLIIIAALVLFTKYRIIKPSEQMVYYLLELNKKQTIIPYDKLPAIWHSWFDTIQNVFKENEVLSHDLQDRNKELEDNYEKLKEEIKAKTKAQKQKKALEERLEQSEKIKMLGQLAGGIAHDFNNQLGIITGYVGLVETKLGEEDPELNEYIDTIMTACDNTTEMTRQLLAYARKGQYELKPIDIGILLKKLANVVQRTFTKKIAVTIDCIEGSLLITGDKGQLDNAFLNLAINARDAMPNGGELTISCNLIEINNKNNKRQLTELPLGSYYCISFKDTGSGIDKETLKHIFEPFFTTKPANIGSGMGLAAVYGTINNHNGTIEVHSKVKGGTTFEIFLPQAQPETMEEPEKIATSINLIEGNTLRTMVIDDEKHYRKMLTTMLNNLGHQVKTFKSQNQAIAHYKTNSPAIDLIVMDMRMPEMSGYELFTALKNINNKIRIIVISGYTDQEDLQKITSSSNCKFLKKPFNTSKLQEAIQSLIK